MMALTIEQDRATQECAPSGSMVLTAGGRLPTGMPAPFCRQRQSDKLRGLGPSPRATAHLRKNRMSPFCRYSCRFFSWHLPGTGWYDMGTRPTVLSIAPETPTRNENAKPVECGDPNRRFRSRLEAGNPGGVNQATKTRGHEGACRPAGRGDRIPVSNRRLGLFARRDRLAKNPPTGSIMATQALRQPGTSTQPAARPAACCAPQDPRPAGRSWPARALKGRPRKCPGNRRGPRWPAPSRVGRWNRPAVWPSGGGEFVRPLAPFYVTKSGEGYIYDME